MRTPIYQIDAFTRVGSRSTATRRRHARSMIGCPTRSCMRLQSRTTCRRQPCSCPKGRRRRRAAAWPPRGLRGRHLHARYQSPATADRRQIHRRPAQDRRPSASCDRSLVHGQVIQRIEIVVARSCKATRQSRQRQSAFRDCSSAGRARGSQ
jgi:hypothetical protein